MLFLYGSLTEEQYSTLYLLRCSAFILYRCRYQILLRDKTAHHSLVFMVSQIANIFCEIAKDSFVLITNDNLQPRTDFLCRYLQHVRQPSDGVEQRKRTVGLCHCFRVNSHYPTHSWIVTHLRQYAVCTYRQRCYRAVVDNNTASQDGRLQPIEDLYANYVLQDVPGFQSRVSSNRRGNNVTPNVTGVVRA